MARFDFREIFRDQRTIIGMIHLPPLPGYKDSPGMQKLIEKACQDLAALEEVGAHGVLVENEYDQPHKVLAPPEIIAAMTAITQAVVREAKIPVGLEILLNDPKASLAAAYASGAQFVRTDYFVDRMTRPEYGGEMAIDPSGLLQYRKLIGAEHVGILADIQVKYATMLEEKTIAKSAQQAVEAGADAIIVTGKLTGKPPAEQELREAKKAVGNHPVLIGSGLDPNNVKDLLQHCDGAIVGTGIISNTYIDRDKASRLMQQVRDSECQ
ncbi:MAG: BtpA/SgcQ family protein [Oligoflexales bacterium]